MSIVLPVSEVQSFRIPAHRFTQGHRTVFTFALDLRQLDSILPQRIDEDVVREANRRLTPSHAKRIENYLREHEDWVLGAILLGIDPDAVTFNPFPDENGRPNPMFGELEIPYNRMNSLRLFDGQHRRRAIQDLLAGSIKEENELLQFIDDENESGENPDAARMLNEQLGQVREKRKFLETQSLPVVLYKEGNVKALRQMFADAAKTKSIESVTRARFDDRDPFNRAAYEIRERSELFRNGRVEMERNTVARTSPSLLAFNQLATTLKTLMFGYYGRVSRIRNTELQIDHEPIVKLGIEWADDFLPACCGEYEQLLNPETEDVSVIPAMRRKTFALNATVLRVLAACFHGWQEEMGEDTGSLAEFLRKHSFKNTLKKPMLVQAGLVRPGDTSPVARRQEVQKAIRYILRNAKRHERKKVSDDG